jgi:cytochrome P450
MSALPVHLSPEHFGSDAAQFRPERWITGSDGLNVEEMNRYWIPFGTGSRSCIGKNVALLEVRLSYFLRDMHPHPSLKLNPLHEFY